MPVCEETPYVSALCQEQTTPVLAEISVGHLASDVETCRCRLFRQVGTGHREGSLGRAL